MSQIAWKALGLVAGAAALVIGLQLGPADGRLVAPAVRTVPATPAAAMAASSKAARPRVAPAPAPSPAPTPAATGYVVKRVLDIPTPFRFGDWYWDDAGVPAGDMIVTVDLKAQVLSVFRGGYEIGTAVMIYGADEKPTPLGVFGITQKDADHVSNLYDAPMPYMLRLTNDGISIHGSDVKAGYVTHGCVGVPTAFARKLFGSVKLGDRVIVSNGERLDLGQAIKAA